MTNINAFEMQMLRTAVLGVIDTWEKYLRDSHYTSDEHVQTIRDIAAVEIKKWTELLRKLEGM